MTLNREARPLVLKPAGLAFSRLLGAHLRISSPAILTTFGASLLIARASFHLGSLPLFKANGSTFWSVSIILAHLVAPFEPAVGTRIVNWARERPLIGRVVGYLFPEERTEGHLADGRELMAELRTRTDLLQQMLANANRIAEQLEGL